MKKLLTFAMYLIIAVTMFAQNDVTQFLGIPVDGTKSEMIRKLKAKGFTTSSILDGALEGEFNGQEVYVIPVTNNKKVWRICVMDKSSKDEGDIKIRFNNLCNQFENNSKYISIKDYSISESEDISYGIGVENKRYEAAYYQRPMSAGIKPMFDYTDEDRDKMGKKSVWFMSDKGLMGYRICMYYDNKYNEANGDDL